MMHTFYTMLCCYEMKCFIQHHLDEVKINKADYTYSDDYIKLLRKYEWFRLPYEFLENILYYSKNGKIFRNKKEKKACIQKNRKNLKYQGKSIEELEEERRITMENILYVIRVGAKVEKIDTRDLSFAVTYLKDSLAMWCRSPQKMDTIYGDNAVYNDKMVTFLIGITALQELIFLEHNNVSFTNDFFECKHKETTYTSIIKDRRSRLGQQYLRIRLWNRYIANLDGLRQLILARQIQQQVYHIMNYVFSFHNYDDIVEQHKKLYKEVLGILSFRIPKAW